MELQAMEALPEVDVGIQDSWHFEIHVDSTVEY
jgi:hypothetical protein